MRADMRADCDEETDEENKEKEVDIEYKEPRRKRKRRSHREGVVDSRGTMERTARQDRHRPMLMHWLHSPFQKRGERNQ